MASLLTYVDVWLGGIKKPEETVERIKKAKFDITDGILSIGLLSLICGIVTFAVIALSPGLQLYLQLYYKLPLTTMFVVCVLVVPIAAAIALVLSTALFRGICSLLKGKGSYEQECGMFGLISGSYVIAALPAMLLGVAAEFFAANNTTAYYILVGIGAVITGALVGLINGVIYELVSWQEKASIPRSGLLLGLANGILVLLITIAMLCIFTYFGLSVPGQTGLY